MSIEIPQMSESCRTDAEIARLKRLLAARPTEMELFAATQNAEHFRAEFEGSANRANTLAGEVTRAHAYEAEAAAWLQRNAGRSFYNVSDFIADLEAGRFSSAPADISTIVERLPLCTPVILPNCKHGVIVGWSTVSCQRYEVAWFDRHFWRVNRRCFDRAQFIVVNGVAETAAEAAIPA